MRVVETVKAMVSPESGDNLLEFLRAFRDCVQFIIDRIWDEPQVPSLKVLHQRFYDVLRQAGFRAHHAKQIYKVAQAIVKATRSRNGSKPILRKLFVRIDKYDYRLDLERGVVIVKGLNGKDIKLKILIPRKRLEKFRGWHNYELVIKYDGEKFWVCIEFRKEVKLYEPRTYLAIDLNFDNVTLVIVRNGRVVKIKRFPTPLRKALVHRIWIERIMRWYPKRWRYVKGIRNAIKKHGRRMKNILDDWCHKLANRIADLAKRYRAKILLEDLNKLREHRTGSSSFNKKLSLWCYRRLQNYIVYEAMEREVPISFIDPRGTSSRCPFCGLKLVVSPNRVVKCVNCGFVGDRDVTACMNLVLIHARCGGVWVTPERLRGDVTPNPMRRNKDEGMKIISTYINL